MCGDCENRAHVKTDRGAGFWGSPPPHEESRLVMRWAHSLVSWFMLDSSGTVFFQILTPAQEEEEASVPLVIWGAHGPRSQERCALVLRSS